jgi:MscS family membrane protein
MRSLRVAGSPGAVGRRSGRAAIVAIVACILLLAPSSWAGPAPAPSGGASGADAGAIAPPEPVAPDSPRASLSAFLDDCRAGKLDAAAGYLDLSGRAAADGPRLAERLKAVFDRYIWFDLASISPKSSGTRDDGLPDDAERIATIPGDDGAKVPIVMIRRVGPSGARWVFSSGVVGNIDALYDKLPNRWTFDHLPPVLLRAGPAELLYWQWLALPLLAAAAWIAGALLALVTRRLLVRVTNRTASRWDDVLVVGLRGPLTLAWALFVAELALGSLHLYQPAEAALSRALRAGFFLAAFWLALRMVDGLRGLVEASKWSEERPAARALVPLVARSAKVGVLVLASISVLSALGYPAASLIASLGIGGLALALAAQKTVENLFGAVAIGVDQPFRVGDFVRIGDIVGTVEAVGLRSTRVRTLDRTLVSIPNGKLADMQVESFAARDRIRLYCQLGLVYDTTAAQMRQVLAGLERTLRQHPKIWPDAVIVRFTGLGESALTIDVMAWFETDWDEFQIIRQDVLLAFMEVVERAGSSFAFPTRTLHIAAGAESLRAAPPRAGRPAPRLAEERSSASARDETGRELT